MGWTHHVVVENPSSLRCTISTPHSTGFACLELEHFTKPSKFGLLFGQIVTSQKVRVVGVCFWKSASPMTDVVMSARPGFQAM